MNALKSTRPSIPTSAMLTLHRTSQEMPARVPEGGRSKGMIPAGRGDFLRVAPDKTMSFQIIASSRYHSYPLRNFGLEPTKGS
jgi:hypothetical protein